MLLSAWLSVTCAALLFSILIAVPNPVAVHPVMLAFSYPLIVIPVPVALPLMTLFPPGASHVRLILCAPMTGPSDAVQSILERTVALRVSIVVQLATWMLLYTIMLVMVSLSAVLFMMVLLRIVLLVMFDADIVLPVTLARMRSELSMWLWLMYDVLIVLLSALVFLSVEFTIRLYDCRVDYAVV